jgi:hypothetical protein
LVKIFVSYSHSDELLRDALEKHLSLLKNQGIIDVWHDRRIELGQEFGNTIDSNLSDAQIILLLISADFIASSYCWSVEMALAMKRHESGTARVIPIILRACDWHSAPFGKLLAAPKDGKPIKSWPDVDEALYDVARQIRIAVGSVSPKKSATPVSPDARKAQVAENSEVYCSRCGARAGTQSMCNGPYTHHNFVKSGKFGAYCSRCGEIPGTATSCTAPYTHHAFVDASRSSVFCARCGVLAGTKTICTGPYTHHNFVSV